MGSRLRQTRINVARAGLTGGAKAVTKNVANAPVASVSKGDQRARKRAEAEARNARSRERRGVEKEVKRLEENIQKAEKQMAELTEELERPETYDNPSRAMTINRDLTTAQSTLDCLTPEWEAACGKLESM